MGWAKKPLKIKVSKFWTKIDTNLEIIYANAKKKIILICKIKLVIKNQSKRYLVQALYKRLKLMVDKILLTKKSKFIANRSLVIFPRLAKRPARINLTRHTPTICLIRIHIKRIKFTKVKLQEVSNFWKVMTYKKIKNKKKFFSCQV